MWCTVCGGRNGSRADWDVKIRLLWLGPDLLHCSHHYCALLDRWDPAVPTQQIQGLPALLSSSLWGVEACELRRLALLKRPYFVCALDSAQSCLTHSVPQ